MTRAEVMAWLESREPVPPPVLAERLTRVVAAVPEEMLAGAMSDAASALGLSTLGAVTDGGQSGEELALDLLAADAFVTYAFEAAAEEGRPVAELAERLLTQVAT